MKLRSFAFVLALLPGAVVAVYAYAQDNFSNAAHDNLPPILQDQSYSLLDNLFPLLKVEPGVQESPLRSVDQYEDAVRELESSHGFYDPELGKELVGLGLAYRTSGRHGDAIEAFKRSMHVTRVNEGLYTLSQLPVLDLIIAENTELEDWKKLDQNYHYLCWLYRRNFGDNDVRLLPAVDRAARWHLRAFDSLLGKRPFGHLLEADKLLDQAVTIIETQYGPTDSRLIDPLGRLALTNYKIALYAANVEDVTEIRPSFLTIGMDDLERWFKEQRVREQVAMDSYRRGKRALSRVAEIYARNPELSVASHATAIAHLGDWYQVFDMRYRAMDQYREAYTLLQNAGTPREHIDRLFGRPHSISDFGVPPADEHKDEPQQIARDRNGAEHVSAYDGPAAPVTPSVTASCDVTAAGEALNVKILENNYDTGKSSSRDLAERIAKARFRPRIEWGKPVKTQGFKFRVVFDQPSQGKAP